MNLRRPVLLAVRAAHSFSRVLSTLVLTLAIAAPAFAQLSLPAGTRNVHYTTVGHAVRGVDSAYDPVNDRYLVVTANGSLRGFFVSRSGVPSAPFTISNSGYGSFPRVVYSQHANSTGGFLVVWTSEANRSAYVKGRIVSPGGALLGTEQNISAPITSFIDVGTLDVAYSPTSQRFLVVWKSLQHQLYGRLVTPTAAPIGAAVNYVSTFSRDPGVAWNSARNEFGVSYSGESGSSVLSGFVRVAASNAASFTRSTFNIKPATQAMTAASDIAYNRLTGRYLMGWFELGSGSRVAEISSDGTILSTGLVSTSGSYDAFSLDANPATHTTLFATLGPNDALYGAELNSRGYRFASQRLLSQSNTPTFYPRVAPSSEYADWLVSFSGGISGVPYSSVAMQPVATSTRNGGPAGTLGSAGATGGGTTAPPPTTAIGCTGASPVPGWVCVNGGWLPPDHPLAVGNTTTPPPTTVTPPPPPPPTSSVPCAGSAPVAGWVCVNGGWLPPDHPLALSAGSTGGGTTTAPPPPTTSCTSVRPGPDWGCVNGNWLPQDQIGLPACTGAQLSGRPVVGWIRLADGGWVPESHPAATQGVCRG